MVICIGCVVTAAHAAVVVGNAYQVVRELSFVPFRLLRVDNELGQVPIPAQNKRKTMRGAQSAAVGHT